MDKSADAFRTISEVADSLDVPQHVLRFWETRFSQIKPMKRTGGRRYYRPDDVELLRGIRHLLYGQGYTIRGVQRILREHGVKAVQQLADGSAMPVARFAPQAGAAHDRALDRHDDDANTASGDTDFDADDRDGDDEPMAAPPAPRMGNLRVEPIMPASPFVPSGPAVRREPIMDRAIDRTMDHAAERVAQPVSPALAAQPAGAAPMTGAASPLRADNVRKLQATLQELVECKRLLNEKIENSAT